MRTTFLLFVFLVGCRSSPVATNRTPDADVPPTSENGSRSSFAPPAPDTGSAMTVDERAAARIYVAALGEGRKATRAKRYDAARAAFDRALVARPDDARAYAERGYASLLAGALDAASSDLSRALRGGLDTELEASVQYNRGLLFEKRGAPEQALRAFAAADQLRSTPARRAKSAGRPACAADVPDGIMDVTIYDDWEALRDAIHPVKDRGTARKSVCVSSLRFDGENADETVCDGSPPWRTSHDYLMYSWQDWWLHPHGTAIVAVHGGRSGTRPATCTNSPSYEVSYEGGIVVAKATFTGEGTEIDENAARDPDSPVVCRDVPGWEETTWFDPATRKRLLTMRVHAGSVRPKVEITPQEVRVEGGGCDRTIRR